MPVPLPNLDDRSYADLVAEARALIPSLYPEWTNHNPSDPGIVLVELLAWLTEMLCYQVNEVPDQNVQTFLGLLGWQKPQDPSSVDLEAAVRATVLGLREQYRAVTVEDFERLALQQWPATDAAKMLGDNGKIKRVRCVPQRNLAAADAAEKNSVAAAHVSVVIIADTPNPYASSLVLEDVNFTSGSVKFTAKYKGILNRAAQALEHNSALGVQIVGHTDKVGSDADQQSISEQRAQTVVDYLAAKGIDSARLQAIGKGASEPVASNETAKGRASNRRVELVTDPLHRALHEFFNERCLLTTRHHIVDPDYVPVRVSATLFIREDAPPEATLNEAIEALYGFFDPLRGGPEQTGWPFGRDVYASEIYALFDNMALVDSVEDVSLKVPGQQERLQSDGDTVAGVTLDAHELVAIEVTELVAIDENGHKYAPDIVGVIGYQPLG